MSLAIIIPMLNEEAIIVPALEKLRAINAQLILVDGGSTDRTLSLAKQAGFAQGLAAPPGRAQQMNFGAHYAQTDILLFLHLDCSLPAGAIEKAEKALQDPEVVGGAFSLGFSPASWGLNIIGHMANLRSRLTGVPYGDQAIFVRRSAFNKLGGFSPIPIMEDVDLCRRLKKLGRLVIIKDKVLASPRRWQKSGMLRTTWRNWFLLTLYHLGFSPERLVRFYSQVR